MLRKTGHYFVILSIALLLTACSSNEQPRGGDYGVSGENPEALKEIAAEPRGIIPIPNNNLTAANPSAPVLYNIDTVPLDALFTIDLSSSKQVEYIDNKSFGLNGVLVPSDPVGIAAGTIITQIHVIYHDVIYVMRGQDGDSLLAEDPLLLNYQCPPGSQIVGLCEGAKYRMYWLENNGGKYRFMTTSTSPAEEASCIWEGELTNQSLSATIAKNGWNDYITFVAQDDAGSFLLKSFSIWDTDNDDFGIGKMQADIPLDFVYTDTATYSCSSNYLARPINTTNGGGFEIIRVGDLAYGSVENQEAYANRVYITGGTIPDDVILLSQDSACMLIDQELFALSLDGKNVFHVASDVDWVRRLDTDSWIAFAVKGCTELYLCNYNLGFQTTLLIKDNEARFTDMDIMFTDCIQTHIVQEKSSNYSVVTLHLMALGD